MTDADEVIRKRQASERAYRQRKRLDPEWRAKQNAYQREYYRTHPELKVYKRDWKRRADDRKWNAAHPGGADHD